MGCYRYEAPLQDHVVSIRRSPSERYEVSIDGPQVSIQHSYAFLSIKDAKMEAHAFAHSKLQAICRCDEGALEWGIVPDP